MNIKTLYELKEKYGKELLIAQAKIEVVDDLIAIEEANACDEAIAENPEELIEFPNQTGFGVDQNVM